MDVSVIILPAEGAVFAQALFAGETLETASRRAGELNGSFDFGVSLIGLVSLGAFGPVIHKDKST